MQKIKKIPMRQCIGCRERKEKKNLIRMVRTPEGEVLADESGRKNGRGAYLCRDLRCLEKAVKSGALNRAFQINMSEEEIEQLKCQVENMNEKQ